MTKEVSLTSPGIKKALESLRTCGPMNGDDWAECTAMNRGTLKAYIPQMHKANLIHIKQLYLNWQNKTVRIYAIGKGIDAVKPMAVKYPEKKKVDVLRIPRPNAITAALMRI